jgi:hypothetical protein
VTDLPWCVAWRRGSRLVWCLATSDLLHLQRVRTRCGQFVQFWDFNRLEPTCPECIRILGWREWRQKLRGTELAITLLRLQEPLGRISRKYGLGGGGT